MKKFRLFQLDNTLSSYTNPLVRILFCIAIILLLLFRDHFIQIDQLIWKIIDGVVCVTLGLVCILYIEIAFAQLLVVHDNRSKNLKCPSRLTKIGKWVPIEKIASLSRINDIIEFKIVSNDTFIMLGASSDLRPGDSAFFGKLYYVGNTEFENFISFQEELVNCAVDGLIYVVSIDGVSPDCFP